MNATLSALLPLALTVMLPLALSEFGELCPWLARKLVRWSARRLGDAQACERYEAEYLASLDEVPGKVSKLLAAFGYVANVPKMRWALRGGRRTRARVTERPTQESTAFVALY